MVTAVSGTEPASEDPSLTLEARDAYRKKLFAIVSHINNVNNAAERLGLRIIEGAKSEDDLDFARRLIQRVRSHDISKFTGCEFLYLNKESDKSLFRLALEQHQQTNDHHPQYYVGGIKNMPELAVAEMVCDWASRASEMGTDLRAYVKEQATVRFEFTTKSKVYRTIKRFVDLLLDDTFS